MQTTLTAARCAALLSAALSLSGCTKPRVIVKPEVEEIPVYIRDPVPAELTAPTPKPYLPQRPLFCDDLERALREALALIDKANEDKAAIRALDKTPATEAGKRGEATGG